MAAVLHPSPNDRGSATHLQERLLGDVPKFPLVPMECGSRGRPSYDGRIPSTQTLREPPTVAGCRGRSTFSARSGGSSGTSPSASGNSSSCNRCTSQAAPLGLLATEKITGKCGSGDGAWKSAVRGGSGERSGARRTGSG